MRNVTLFLLILCCLSLVGCGKRDPVSAFVTELDSTTADMVKKIETGDITGAKKAFEAKKASLIEKSGAMKKLPETQITKESTDKVAASVKKNLKALDDVIAAHAVRKPALEDKAEGLKWVLEEVLLKKLHEDYNDFLVLIFK